MSSYAEHITTAHIQCDAEEALLPTYPFTAVSVADAAIADEAEITAHNDRIEHLSNAINSTYGILYCHLSFKALVV
ncbi:TPA: hypothetical protein LSH94_001011 [Morganella morganii]|nr:hypothetical protein [Morganella morganii]